MTICEGLESVRSLYMSDIFIELDCLEVVNLLNDISLDFSKVSFFIDDDIA